MSDSQAKPTDISWGTFVGALSIMFVVFIVFAGVPTGGGGSVGNSLVLTNYFGRFIGSFTAGAMFIFAPMAIISRRKYGSIRSPKRDLVIGTFVALIIQIVVP